MVGAPRCDLLLRRALPLSDQHHAHSHLDDVVVRYLRFPIAQPLDAAKEQKYKRVFTLGLLALVLPSAFILYNTVSRSVTSSNSGVFLRRSSFLGLKCEA